MADIKPQKGFQEAFLASSADLVFGGGAAGCGKSFGLLLEPTRHLDNPNFGAVVFRRTYPEFVNEGGLWDTSESLYPLIGGKGSISKLVWNFGSGAKIKFSHLEHEKDIFKYQGTQIPCIAFDELTHFTAKQFFYLLSRNRSTCGVKPYARATMNPQGAGWVKDFISWFLDVEDYPDPKKCGKLRYFTFHKGQVIWANSKAELIQLYPYVFENRKGNLHDTIKSFTFIPGTLDDNQILLSKDPGYRANLLSQDEETVMQLYHGRWRNANDPGRLISDDALEDMFETSYVVSGKKYITADIALEGSDQFVIGFWEGWRLVDVIFIPSSDGKEVVEHLKNAAASFGIPHSSVAFDAAGVGGFVKGWLRTAKQYVGGSSAIGKDKFRNLKAQCAWKLAEVINAGLLYIEPNLHRSKIEIQKQFRILKKDAPISGKHRLITKSEMVNQLGYSPDILDMFLVRAFIDIQPKKRKSTYK